jgi:ATP-binding cassette, subfamily B, beta-glucan exporter
MRELLRLYAQALHLLLVDHPIAWGLFPANLALVAALFAEPIVFGRLIDSLTHLNLQTPEEGWAQTVPYLGIWAGIGVFEIALSSFTALQADRLAHLQRQRVLSQTYARVLEFSAAHLSHYRSGELNKIITQGSDALWALWLGFFRDYLTALLALWVLIPVTFALNPTMAVLLVVLAGVFGALSYGVLRKTEGLQKEVESHHTALASRLSDTLAHITLIQSFVRIRDEVTGLGKISERLLNAQLPVLYWWTFIKISSRLSITVTLLSLITLGVWLFVHQLTTVGEIVTFISIAMLIFGRLEQCVQFIMRLSSDAPKLSDFFALSLHTPSLQDSPNATEIVNPKGRIEFKEVSFSYDGVHPVLNRLSFTLEPGQHVALVGHSGAGKSTVLKLLMREYEVSAGAITLDGIDLRDIKLNSWREHLGIVFQDSMLLDRSVSENLSMGNPSATLKDIQEALEMTQAREFVKPEDPEGHATLGEGGKKLSGGERQRLSIARAMLKDPPILVWDEATSSLDTQTEGKITTALKAFMRRRTVLMITHRLQTLQEVDLILVLKDGQIIERGTYPELMAQGGLFREFVMVNAQ